MAFDLVEPLMAFLAEYGLFAIFVFLVLDGAMMMPVLPGEIVMIMAVAEYAEDLQDLAMLVALATVAAILGSLILYGISRGGGRALIERHPKLFMMHPSRREKLENAFQHPVGQSLVMFLRVIPLTRVLINIPAGLARMKVGRFIVLSSIGMLVFHAGFMWIAFRYGGGGGITAQATAVQDAVASPAWQYMQANELVTGLGLLALGAFLSFRASRRVFKDPEWYSRSAIGLLAERVLFWGGIAVLVVLWVDPGIIFELAEEGSVDLRAVAQQYNWEPVSFVAIGAGIATALGAFLMLLSKRAKKRKKRHKRKKAQEDDEDDLEEFEAVKPTGRAKERTE